jgi:hypothetical protein
MKGRWLVASLVLFSVWTNAQESASFVSTRYRIR